MGYVWWATRLPVEPSYQNRPLSAWVAGFNYDVGEYPGAKFERSAEAIRQMGTNAIPPLLEMMRRQDSPFKAGLIDFLRRRVGMKRWPVTAIEEQLHGAFGLAALGPMARPAIQGLAQMAGDDHAPGAVYYALKGIGSEGILAIGELCKSRWCEGLWQHYKHDLSLQYPARPEEISRLLDDLRAKETHRRIQAADAMGRRRNRELPLLIVPALAASLNDIDTNVRWFSAEALGKFGSQAESALPALTKAASEDNSTDVRSVAATAIKKIQTDLATKATPSGASNPVNK